MMDCDEGDLVIPGEEDAPTTDQAESATADGVRLIPYVTSHMQEMLAMDEDIQRFGNTLAMQSVPRHMRRRAASHDIRRLPRRMRAKMLWEQSRAGSAPKTTKRPSRRHRRRPKNLLVDYQRRSRKNVWLETHIWHAKRFHMAELWGYKIPLHPNDKGIRAAYRANNQFCLMHDVSYLCCIEVQGLQKDIIDNLRRLTSSETGLGFGAKTYLSGNRQGQVFMYAKDQYPFKALCEACFIWRPDDVSDTASRVLWIWVHPSTYTDLLNEIVAVFKVEKIAAMESNDNKEESVENIIFKSDCITVQSLKDALCRFRLRGPLTQSILKAALIPSEQAQSKSEAEDEASSKWWQQYYKKKTSRKVLKEQIATWNSACEASSPAELPPGMVLGLTVRDPRLFICQKKKLQEHNVSDQIPLCEHPCGVSSSPLWEEDVRDAVKSTKITEQEFNALRSKQLVPGGVLDLGQDESCIPLILIQSPGRQRSVSSATPEDHKSPGFAAGWDIILPSGWSMAFWISLVYRGGRAAGLKELRSTALEMSQQCFPYHYPDTQAGQSLAQTNFTLLRDKYNRIPPSKRPNYIKLGIVSPFKCPWEELCTEWAGAGSCMEEDTNELFVIRSLNILRLLQTMCTASLPDTKSVADLLGKSCLVPVHIHVLLRGHPSDNATISLPLHEDIEALSQNSKYSGPVEQNHPVTEADTKKGFAEVKNVVDTCDRRVIGFVTSGDFILSQGSSSAIGYIAIQGLVTLLKAKNNRSLPVVLVRDCNSYQYRYAKISIQVP